MAMPDSVNGLVHGDVRSCSSSTASSLQPFLSAVQATFERLVYKIYALTRKNHPVNAKTQQTVSLKLFDVEKFSKNLINVTSEG